MNNFIGKLLLLLFLSLTSSIYGQITIGSIEKPMAGALLDLKEYEADSYGTTSTRGLGLPRVVLKRAPSLQIGTWNPANSEYIPHTGLVVYNSEYGDPCEADPVDVGLNVWDGERWQSIPKSLVSTSVLVDARAGDQTQEYLTGDFGNAGVWMLENLRAKKFAERTDPADVIITELPSTPSLGTDDVHGYDILWGYPGFVGNEDANNSSLYDSNNKLGLLYTFGAATNKRPIAEDVNEGGEKHTRRQGICPKGWHLPNDDEWTMLENEILKKTSSYATMDNIVAPLIVDTEKIIWLDVVGNQDNRGPGLGQAMRSNCKGANAGTGTTPPPNGKSKYPQFGGLNLLLPGFARKEITANPMTREYGASQYLWTGSSTGRIVRKDSPSVNYITGYIRLSHVSIPGSARHSLSLRYLLSVRCKQD